DPNLSDEVRITVIATGFDHSVKTQMLVEPSRGTTVAKSKPQQITLPYEGSTQITRDYPPPTPPRLPAKTAPRADEPDMEIEWATPDAMEVNAVERALADLSDPIPAGEPSQKMAA